MTSSPESLKWSAQLQVTESSRRLTGDKITLPQSALEQLLAAAPVVSIENGRSRNNYTSTFDPFNPYTFAAERQARQAAQERQPQLPHPLTFRLVNPRNGRAVYAGIREFSAEENQIGLSPGLKEALGLTTKSETPSISSRQGTPAGDVAMADTVDAITVHAKQLPKGTYVKLRPLEAGYDPEDWKSLLERHLRDNFTTLTNGEVLLVPGLHQEKFRFLVDKLEPSGDGICIVDTDLEVDIEPLTEEQARETMNQKLAKIKQTRSLIEGNSSGGSLEVGQEVQGHVLPGSYIDYQLKTWDHGQDLVVTLSSDNSHPSLDVLVAPLSSRHRAQPRLDYFVYGDLSERPSKKLKLAHTSTDLKDAELLNITVHAWSDPETESDTGAAAVPYSIQVSSGGDHVSTTTEADSEATITSDEVICKNCRQIVPKRTLHLHEAFCYRNNIVCEKCSNVFLKNSDTWRNHWHCPHDNEYGDDAQSQKKHNSIFHPSNHIRCSLCDFDAFDTPTLAHHKTTDCPGKEILCCYCHLIVPQQGPDDPSFRDPEVILAELTPHEVSDGARTTECHICSKIVRQRDMKIHLSFHGREFLVKGAPRLCSNKLCGRRIIYDQDPKALTEHLGLCNECFGPLYVSTYDPAGKLLRRRVERRLLQQLIGGCGKKWCTNAELCKTGYQNVTGKDRVITAKDGLPLLQPIMKQLAQDDTSGLSFCVDEASQNKRAVAEMLAAEGLYDLNWCIQALEESRGNPSVARDWLIAAAPKIGES
ncbi:hypothetical protein PV10_06930 [Exophiala mesophila]|uniref:Ubiquitin-protein ligase E3A N-terminal zinc-binding domain-containing protein n=1 Tax=Exophiala mesophila TaxID=212818 RepID=A0A0D1Z469_EXOME|nr:uncharacterized protein PV10_06930 [Exophiala mesophila]KIV89537.1 hypothetical protein PV10_06930 [Exophiala mesophila]